ncbi:MAG: PIG-L family deacetylase [Anaerolineales bacterium]|nr:PIG-L family deacetylase [Anaerolineales bacterium]
MNILVIATHPDDEVLGCGGTIARHASRGDKVDVLVVTRGSSDLYDDQQVKTLRKELDAAQAILGVSTVHFLDFPAPKLDLVPTHELADAMAKKIAELRPAATFIPHRGDLHSDHRAVFQAALVAARPIGGRIVRRLLSYETLSETEWTAPVAEDAFLPSVFLEISDFLERKKQALAAYRSQLKEFPHPRSLQAVEALARLRGSTVGVPAAEAFQLIREID